MAKKNDSLGDRMKGYEGVFSQLLNPPCARNHPT